MLQKLTLCVFLGILLFTETGLSQAQTTPIANSDLFPKIKPVFTAPASATVEELRAPLVSSGEQANYDKIFAAIVAEATKGGPEDRAAAVELIIKKSENTGISPGAKSLALLAAWDLAKDSGAAPEDLVKLAERVLRSVDAPTVAMCARQAAILENVYAITEGKSDQFPAGRVAQAYYQLAEAQYYAEKLGECEKSLASGDTWAKRDPRYQEFAGKMVERFRLEIRGEIETESTLAAKPDDPAANQRKGLRLLVRSGDGRQAGPYLSKSNSKEIRRLGAALTSQKAGADARLEVANAALDCFALLNEKEMTSLALLMQSQLAAITSDRNSTDEQRAKAELLSVKSDRLMRQLAAKSDTAGAATAPAASKKQVTFFGVVTEGKRIVYILDHSGSLLDNFDFIRERVRKSIDGLEDGQFFNVVMVSEISKSFEPKGLLVAATDANKTLMTNKLKELRAQGQNDDLLAPFKDAFECAFKIRPDVIYFLTDGHFDPKLLTVVSQLNADHKTKVNTLAFVNKEAKYEEQLKEMAQKNGGTYKFISEKDLGR